MKYAIIPAAGSGTRMKELGKNYAKTVLPYEGKPILIHIIDGLIENVNPDEIIVVYSNDDHLEQMTNVVNTYGKTVTFKKVQQFGRQGPAKSILSGIPHDVTEQDELFIHLSDFVTVEKHAYNIEIDTIAAFPVTDQHRWCMVSGKGQLTFYDKPKEKVPTDLAVAGLYYIGNARRFLADGTYVEFDGDREFQISEVLQQYNYTYPMGVSVIEPSALKDFGTIEEFIQNRGISKTRSFNKIEVNGHFVKKTSDTKPDKLRNEYNWYNCLPPELAIYTPRVFDRTKNGYTMELVQSTNLRELYLYLDRSQETWEEIFGEVRHFVENCQAETLDGYPRFWDSVFEKNYSRVAGTTYESEAIEFLDGLHYELSRSRFYGEMSPYHGDMHFANMFYCFHYKQLRLIDPNGNVNGHWFYDIAKLYHSVVGKYDWIDAELYSSVGFMDKGIDGVQKAFFGMLEDIGVKELRLLKRLTASLFLTMIPLHDHSPKNQELFLNEFRRLSE
jgi:dTDP-glucose pyrophosphorylase